MPRQGKDANPPREKGHGAAKTWSRLTWGDLEDWAGSRSVSRGQSYQRQGRVTDLVVADDGRLLATVTGTRPLCDVSMAWAG